eukprot:gene14402-30666_t
MHNVSLSGTYHPLANERFLRALLPETSMHPTATLPRRVFAATLLASCALGLAASAQTQSWPTKPAEFSALLQREYQRWERTVKAAGIKQE